jgi:hypothetical protein
MRPCVPVRSRVNADGASLVGDLVFHRGGNGFVDAQNVKYGHLAVSDLASDPGQPVPSGGGMVRALLREGQVVRPCDVRPLELPAYDREGAVNGSVTGRYVAAEVAAGVELFGWMVWSHRSGDAAPVAHAEPAAAS